MSFLDSEDGRIDGVTLTLAIAIGVAVGTIVAGLVLWKVAEYQMSASLREATQQAQRAIAAQVEAAKAQQQRATQARAEAEQQRVRDLAAVQRAEAAAQTEAIAQAERREQAWRKFYRPSPGCGGAAVSVECSNEFIRAKRAFDEKFARGEL